MCKLTGYIIVCHYMEFKSHKYYYLLHYMISMELLSSHDGLPISQFITNSVHNLCICGAHVWTHLSNIYVNINLSQNTI